MRKVIKMVKENIKIIVGIVFGIIVSNLVVYAVSINSSDVAYTDNASLGTTNVQGAIDKLNTKVDNKNKIYAWIYNQTSDAPNYCVTGNESTCTKTTCYETKTAGSCPSGTIVDYYVNGTTKVRFHVIEDKGTTMTMQSQRNTIYNTKWYTANDNTKGPTNILPILEAATTGWTNVNEITYTMGTTVFKDSAYTGCSSYNSCTTNTYTLASRTGRARMITVQETAALGCTNSPKSCPIWMYNYLYDSTSNNGTVNDTNTENGASSNNGYWTMSAHSSNSRNAWIVLYSGYVVGNNTSSAYFGARAVVEITK